MTVSSSHSTPMKYGAWGVLSLFFFYQYFLRVAPGIMIENLREEFHLSAEEFSTLGSYYLYAYALIQVPLGILMDAIGVRKTAGLGLLLTVIAGFVMWDATTLWQLQASRLLLGIGSGAAFLCALKFVSDHFLAGKRGFFMGGTLCFGLVGAIFAGSLLVTFVHLLGWRNTLLYGTCVGIGLLFCILFFVKEKPRQSMNLEYSFSLGRLFQDIRKIVTHPMIMLYAILAIGVYTPESVLADLWGTGFLMQRHHLSQTEAAFSSTSMYLGMGMGSFLLPWLCEKYKLLNQGIQACLVLLLGGFLFILFGPQLSPELLTLSFIVIGFFSGAEMMCFTGAALYTSPRNSGITMGVVNTLNMLMGGILQQGIGKFLDYLWRGGLTKTGLKLYTSQNYVTALSLLLGVIGICFVLSLFLKSSRYPETSS